MLRKIINQIKEYDEIQFSDWKIISSAHNLDRIIQRFELSPSIIDELLKKTVIFFDNCSKCLSTEYLIYSRKYEQGFIINLKKDKKEIKIITFLPPKKQTISNQQAYKTQKIFIENMKNKVLPNDITEYLILTKPNGVYIDEDFVNIDKIILDLDKGVIL